MPKQILIVDDDPALGAELARLVRALDREPVICSSAAVAIARLGEGEIDLCLVDLDLPAAEGTAVVLKARACRPPVAAVALTARGAGAVEALRAGAAEIVAKPFSPTRLTALLRRHTDGGARRSSGGAAVVGDHPCIRKALERVDQIAGTDLPVLLRGEAGTGKETLARLIHGASARRDGPFVAVNLAAIPEKVSGVSSVLGSWGKHERPRAGWMLAAQGGTIFLEAIDELSPEAQRKLLRALRDGTVSSPDGLPVPLEARIVAATCRDLGELVAAGLFDEDLHLLLRAGAIELPPLRERREDIPALAEHFRRQVNAREGRRVPGFALDVMHRFSQHGWPGNVRELEYLCERLVVMAGSRMVVMKDLPSHLRIQVIDFERATRRLPVTGVDLRELLTELEERFIAEALARTGGNRNRAADLLGLNRTTLVEKLRRRYVA
ncbi:MAG TPA: sigma-54 dependent transcriptional regulator [Polyangia bacterium]|jgi:DNA-binding NtrC family response regulator|nr:sigma-54 dependent transcriptional regulator [Polyangia bacterium]